MSYFSQLLFLPSHQTIPLTHNYHDFSPLLPPIMDFVPHRPNQHFTLHTTLDCPRAEAHPGPDVGVRETGARPPILDPVLGPRGAVGVEL